jgi:pilus assembly protein CpaE
MSAAVQPLTVIDTPLARPVSVMGLGLDPTDWTIILDNMPEGAACTHLQLPPEEAERVVRERRPEVVLVAFAPEAGSHTPIAPRLLQIDPSLTLLAVAQVPDPAAIREAMRAGFRDYLVLPDDLAALRRTVREVAESAAPTAARGRRGDLIALMGAKGGSGTTLLSVNLGAELAELGSSLVLDMDFVLGDTAVFLDLSPERSMADVLRNVARLDEDLFAASISVHSTGLRVLPQPTMPLEDVGYDSEAVMRTLDLAAAQADHVVVDCGAGVNEATMVTVSTADRVLLVVTPDVPSIRAAWIRLQLLDRLDVPRERIRVVVNRWGAYAGLSRREIEEHLGCSVHATVNDDPKAAGAAVNEGQLLREHHGRAKLTRDIGKLAGSLAGTDGRTTGGGRASWFGFARNAAK